MLTVLAVLLGIYYYRIFGISIIGYVFWNFVVAAHSSLPQAQFYEVFFSVFSIYLIGELLRGALGKSDMTIERLLK